MKMMRTWLRGHLQSVLLVCTYVWHWCNCSELLSRNCNFGVFLARSQQTRVMKVTLLYRELPKLVYTIVFCPWERRHSRFPCKPFSECSSLLCTHITTLSAWWWNVLRVETLLALRGTCCDSVGDEWRTFTIWFTTRNWIFLLTDASQKLWCPQYLVRLVWTLSSGNPVVHVT
jgi:hypothetical protein